MAAGIYIHIPFCVKKCNYCDFFSQPVDDENIIKSYTRALLKEIAFYGEKYGKKFEADSVFFGGGTPSLIKPSFIARIIEDLRQNFDIKDDAEISMECNPATADEEKLAAYRKAGVNRLSIGAQSFDDHVLKKLGRIHTASDITQTIKAARKSGFENINLDLMFAVPGLDGRKWRSTIRKALNARPEHISFYSLEIAPGTPFYNMVKDGIMAETSPAADRRMYSVALDELEKAGYIHYEISNSALPHKECRHNLKYWRFSDYLGFGASAHSFMGGVRFSNIADIKKYIRVMENQDLARNCRLGGSEVIGADCVDWFHVNTVRDSAGEYTFTALRTRRGVILPEFAKKFKCEFWEMFLEEKPEFETFVRQEYAVSDSHHIALTKKGIDISNKIMALFV